MLNHAILFLIFADLSQLGYWPQGAVSNGGTNSLISYAAFAAALVYLILNRHTVSCRFSGGLWLFVTLIIWTTACAVISDDPVRAITGVAKLAVIGFTIVEAHRRDEQAFYSTLRSFVAVFAVANITVILLFPSFGTEQTWASRAGDWRGLLPYKTQLGMTCLILLALDPRLRWRTLLLGILIVGSGSRMAWSAGLLCAAVALAYWAIAHSNRVVRSGKALLAGAALIALWPVWANAAPDIFAAIGRDPSFTGRSDIWLHFWSLAEQRALFGYGMGVVEQDGELIRRIHLLVGWDGFRSAHSSPLEWALAAGYLGGGLFSALLLFACLRGVAHGAQTACLAVAVAVPTLLTSMASAVGAVWFALLILLVKPRAETC